MSTTPIEASGISCQLGGKPILSKVSLSVKAGDFLSIIGPNGAGKTTLLRCLLGIQKISAGSIAIMNKPLETWSRRELAKTISYVPQVKSRALPFTVGEFIAMGRYPYLGPLARLSSEDHAAINQAMNLTGTAVFADRRMETLSGGEQQEVMIAAALAQDARIMLLDEPATFLDYRHQNSVRKILQEINRQTGVTIIAVTHDVNAAISSSSTVLALDGGHSVFQGSPTEVADPAVLETIFNTRFTMCRHPDNGQPVILPGSEP